MVSAKPILSCFIQVTLLTWAFVIAGSFVRIFYIRIVDHYVFILVVDLRRWTPIHAASTVVELTTCLYSMNSYKRCHTTRITSPMI